MADLIIVTGLGSLILGLVMLVNAGARWRGWALVFLGLFVTGFGAIIVGREDIVDRFGDFAFAHGPVTATMIFVTPLILLAIAMSVAKFLSGGKE